MYEESEKAPINGKVVLITGGAGDIGYRTAIEFAQNGDLPILADIKHNIANNQFDYIKLDVTKEEDWISAVNYIEQKYQKLDVLINSAGITGTEDQEELDIESTTLLTWEKVHAVNLNGAFLGCKHAIGIMKKNHSGSIINIGSRSGITGRPGRAAYCSSKAALHHLSRVVALHCAKWKYNIRCNSIIPGLIKSKLWQPVIDKAEKSEKETLDYLSRQVPVGRFGTCQEVARAILFLSSSESSYINGSEIIIDGGLLAGRIND